MCLSSGLESAPARLRRLPLDVPRMLPAERSGVKPTRSMPCQMYPASQIGRFTAGKCGKRSCHMALSPGLSVVVICCPTAGGGESPPVRWSPLESQAGGSLREITQKRQTEYLQQLTATPSQPNFHSATPGETPSKLLKIIQKPDPTPFSPKIPSDPTSRLGLETSKVFGGLPFLT